MGSSRQQFDNSLEPGGKKPSNVPHLKGEENRSNCELRKEWHPVIRLKRGPESVKLLRKPDRRRVEYAGHTFLQWLYNLSFFILRQIDNKPQTPN